MHLLNVYLNYFPSFKHALNTVGGAAETRKVLQSVMDRQMDMRTDKGKTICPSPLRGGGIKRMDPVKFEIVDRSPDCPTD